MALEDNATGEHCARLRMKAAAIGSPQEACRLLTEMGQLLTKRCASQSGCFSTRNLMHCTLSGAVCTWTHLASFQHTLLHSCVQKIWEAP